MNNNYEQLIKDHKQKKYELHDKKWLIVVFSIIALLGFVYYNLNQDVENEKVYSVTFLQNDALSIEKKALSCTVVDNYGCTIIMPEIAAVDGYTVIGWSKDKNAASATYLVGKSYIITDDISLYAITKPSEIVKEFTVTFNANTALSVAESSLSCKTASNSCSVIMPAVMAKDGYEALGFSEDANALVATYKVGGNYAINRNMTLYAITKKLNNSKTFTIKFEKNTALSIKNEELSCSTSDSNCNIIMPEIIAKDGYEVIGWSKNKNSQTASYLVGKEYQFNQDVTLYAITKKNDQSKTYTINFDKNTASSISSTSLSCQTMGSSCGIILPTITPKLGNEVVGWSTSASSSDVIFQVGSTYQISKNTKLYAITKPKAVIKTFTITFNRNTAAGIESASLSCQTTSSRCSITMPSIMAKPGYEVVGWSPSTSDTSHIYQVGNTYQISQNMTLYAITNQTIPMGLLSGSELATFKNDNNINRSSNFVVERTAEIVSGVTFEVYYVYDSTNYTTEQLSNLKTFAQHSLTNLARVDRDIIKYVANYGTKIVFFGSYTCDNAIANLGYYTYSAYCNSINRNIVIGYEANRLNWNHYENSIVHEFGHAFDFSLRYSIVGDLQAGISALSEENILNGFNNNNGVFVSSDKVSLLFNKNSFGNPYSWTNLATKDADALKTVNGFTLYSTMDLISRPHEYFADTFAAYYTPDEKNAMESIAPDTFAGIKTAINYIKR